MRFHGQVFIVLDLLNPLIKNLAAFAARFLQCV